MKTIAHIKRGMLLLLAMLVFTTSSCFAMDVHHCSGKVESYALIGKAKVCEKHLQKELEEENLPECCKKAKALRKKQNANIATFSSGPCCYNDAVSFMSDQTNDHFSPAPVLVSLDLFIATFGGEKLMLPRDVEVEKEFLDLPPPPLIQRDFQSLFQVYLI